MKLGDNPELRGLAGGGNPGQSKPPPRGPSQGGKQQSQSKPDQQKPQPRLPDKFVLDTFYGPDGKLRQELFYDLPRELAQMLSQHKLPKTKKAVSMGQLRSLYTSMARLAKPLEPVARGQLDSIAATGLMSAAREGFGHFYVHRVVYQAKRGYLPQMLVDLVEKHRDLALSDAKEMYGLFTYIKHILCYYEEPEKPG